MRVHLTFKVEATRQEQVKAPQPGPRRSIGPIEHSLDDDNALARALREATFPVSPETLAAYDSIGDQR